MRVKAPAPPVPDPSDSAVNLADHLKADTAEFRGASFEAGPVVSMRNVLQKLTGELILVTFQGTDAVHCGKLVGIIWDPAEPWLVLDGTDIHTKFEGGYFVPLSSLAYIRPRNLKGEDKVKQFLESLEVS